MTPIQQRPLGERSRIDVPVIHAVGLIAAPGKDHRVQMLTRHAPRNAMKLRPQPSRDRKSFERLVQVRHGVCLGFTGASRPMSDDATHFFVRAPSQTRVLITPAAQSMKAVQAVYQLSGESLAISCDEPLFAEKNSPVALNDLKHQKTAIGGGNAFFVTLQVRGELLGPFRVEVP